MSDNRYGPDGVTRVSTTPSWVGPPRQRNGLHVVPQQATPGHDDTVEPVHPKAPMAFLTPAVEDPALTTYARWQGNSSGRGVMTVFLSAAVAGTVISASHLATTQSSRAVGLMLALLFLTALLYAVLAATQPLDVVLDGTRLIVKDSDGRHRFELTEPYLDVAMDGDPDSRHWRLALGRPDHSILVLRPRHVDPHVVHPVVLACRAHAERRRQERRRRFER